MSRDAVSNLVNRLVNEPAFRDEIRKDPEGAVKRAGAQLTSEEWSALKNIDWNLRDEELKTRINKIP